MSKNVTRYDLLISCPGDVKDEVDLIKESVEEFNEKFSNALSIMIQVRHWKTSSFSQSGKKPQAILNEQFVCDCDAAVAVFWTRFGTPTDEYGSGTEEEIEIMLNAGKQVFLYFSEKPASLSDCDFDQYDKIKSFKKKYKDKGVYFTYKTNAEFRNLFFSHLTQYFLNKQNTDSKDNNKPKISIRGISSNNMLDDNIGVRYLPIIFAQNIEYDMAHIKALFGQIDKIDIKKEVPSTFTRINNYSNSDVTISKNVKDVVLMFAESMSISIGENFFDVGNLSENRLFSAAFNSEQCLKGTSDEKQKYSLIKELYNTGIRVLSLVPIIRAYENIPCLYLAVDNIGTAIDEDIELTMIFGKNEILSSTERPDLDDFCVQYLLDKDILSQLLSIPRSAEYYSYADSQNSVFTNPGPIKYSSSDVSSGRDIQEEYTNAFSSVLHYDIFETGNEQIIKLKFDYIKHHSAVAFPAPILLKQTPKEIKYKITSKHMPDMIEGSINVIS